MYKWIDKLNETDIYLYKQATLYMYMQIKKELFDEHNPFAAKVIFH